MRPTLRQVFAFSLFGLLVGLSLLFFLVFNGSQKNILSTAEGYRELVSQEVAQLVRSYLGEAPEAVNRFEQE